LLGDKFAYLSEQLDPEHRDRQLATVLSLPGLPSQEEYGRSERIDIEQLLRIRESSEGKAFRAWFHSAGAADIEEMAERWNSLSIRLAAATHGTVGREIRFAVSTAAGLIPGAGLAIGTAVGVLDNSS
jgi:hypothetical protein